jgi:hypothetical protein
MNELNANRIACELYTRPEATDWHSSTDDTETVEFGERHRVVLADEPGGGVSWTWYVGGEDVTTDGWPDGRDAGMARLNRCVDLMAVAAKRENLPDGEATV